MTQIELAQTDASKAVLVVEDEPDLLEVTCFALECEGFGVQTARNGQEALALLRGGTRPGVVLLDLMMPVMSGWQFLDELARLPALQAIPIVVLTAGGEQRIPGATMVLRKPLDLGVLIETVGHHTRPARGSCPSLPPLTLPRK